MSAAEQLAGLQLDDGWKVTRHLPRPAGATGGTFSQSYEARNGDRLGFLKAFDFAPAFAPGVDTPEIIQIMVESYNHERDVLSHCRERRMSNVVLSIDHGSVQVPNLPQMEGRVFYMIFELATGDVRVQMDTNTQMDVLWCMRALRDVSLGLHQVHREMIAHQDMKPSNVLTYRDGSFKVADFGRASRKGHSARHDHLNIAGDMTYAPPELLYGFLHQDFAARRIGCDLYMLGNLAAFLFSGVNMSALLLSHLDVQQHPKNWGGTYDQALPYVQSAFAKALEDLRTLVDENVRADVLRMIRELCEPDLDKRGHPRGIGKPNQYSLERYVSELDLAARRLAIKLAPKRNAA